MSNIDKFIKQHKLWVLARVIMVIIGAILGGLFGWIAGLFMHVVWSTAMGSNPSSGLWLYPSFYAIGGAIGGAHETNKYLIEANWKADMFAEWEKYLKKKEFIKQ